VPTIFRSLSCSGQVAARKKLELGKTPATPGLSSPGLTGRSSTPRLLDSIAGVSGILGRPVKKPLPMSPNGAAHVTGPGDDSGARFILRGRPQGRYGTCVSTGARMGARRAQRFSLRPNEVGPGASEHRGARNLRVCEEWLIHISFMSRSVQRVAFALRSRGIYSDCRRRYDRWQLLFTSTRAVTLRLSKVKCSVTGWRHSPHQV
jgi:hypothetical protein